MKKIKKAEMTAERKIEWRKHLKEVLEAKEKEMQDMGNLTPSQERGLRLHGWIKSSDLSQSYETPIYEGDHIEVFHFFKDNGIIPLGDSFSEHTSWINEETKVRSDIYSVKVELPKKNGGKLAVWVNDNGTIELGHITPKSYAEGNMVFKVIDLEEELRKATI